MKKIMPFSVILLLLLYEPVYATPIVTMPQDVKVYTNILAFGLVFIGLIIIIMTKISGESKQVYIEKEKNTISGLKDQDKLNEIKEFDPDSIFKILPTFSRKKFEEETRNEIDKKLKTEDNNFVINEFKLVDFKDEEEKYTIKSMISSETGTNKEKEKSVYEIISINQKIKNENVRCPVCGGKIKDLTKLRCTYCGSILPNNNDINNDEWKIESIEKTTK